MFIILALLVSSPIAGAQDYGEYNEYQVYTDGESTARNWGFNFIPQAIYFKNHEDNDISGQSAISRVEAYSLFDLRFGHVFRQGFYLGMIYAGEQQTAETTTGDYQTSRQSLGISGGYLHGGWTMMLHYYLFSTQEVDWVGATHTEYTKGSGWQIDMGYHFRVTHWLAIGPMLTYKNYSYGEAENATTSVDADANVTQSFLTPMLSVMFTLYR